MYVCVCMQVTDREIERAIDEGARTVCDLSDCLGVATGCGRCAPYADQMLKENCPNASLPSQAAENRVS